MRTVRSAAGWSIFAVSCIIVTADLAIYSSQRSVLSTLKAQPPFLNTAGRQRMLSQRIIALHLAPASCAAQYNSPALLTELQTVHETQMNRYAHKMSAQYQALTDSLAAYTAAVTDSATTPCILLEHGTAFLDLMVEYVNDVVSLQNLEVDKAGVMPVALTVLSACVQVIALLVLLALVRWNGRKRAEHEALFSSFILHEASSVL
jgi:hypothetical protein